MPSLPTAHRLLLPLALALRLAAQQGEVDPRAAVAQLPLEPRALRGVEVQVLDEAGRPAERALLLTMPDTVPPARMRDWSAFERRFEGDPLLRLCATAALLGRRWAIGGDGACFVPSSAGTRIVAIDGARVAIAAMLDAEGHVAPRIRLQLAPVPMQTVTVVQDGGAPAASVPLSVFDSKGQPCRITVSTGADGAAQVPLLATSTALQPPFQVRAQVVTRKAVEAACQPGLPPLRLALPPCGRVEIAVQGLPADAGTPRITLQPVTSGQTRNRSSASYAPTATRADGASFAFVEPGVPLRAVLGYDGLATTETLRLDVPEVASGAVASATFDLATLAPRVVLHVRDDDGKPLANTDVYVMVLQGRGSGSWPVRTSADGRIDVPLDPKVLGETSELRLDQRSGSGWQSAIARSAQVPIGKLTPGANDRGAVTLSPAPIALRGRIVDQGGKGVGGIVLQMQSPNGYVYSESSDANGAFAIAMPKPHPAEAQVQLVDGDWMFVDAPQRSLACTTGDAGCELVVQRAARLRIGMTSLPPDVDQSLSVVARRRDDAGEPFSTSLPQQGKPLRLPPGTWDLQLQLYGQEVLALEDVLAEPGIETHDPRLMELDWRAFADLAAIRVERPDGTPCDDCTVWVYHQHNFGRSGSGRSPQNGSVRYLLPKQGTTIEIDPREPGLRHVDLGDFRGERTVRLTEALRVELTLTNLPPMPEGATLEARLNLGPRSGQSIAVGADGKVTLFADNPGNATVMFVVRKGNTTHYTRSSMPIEVGEQGLQKSLELTADAREGIEQQLERLAK